jgi:hypothetical protein
MLPESLAGNGLPSLPAQGTAGRGKRPTMVCGGSVLSVTSLIIVGEREEGGGPTLLLTAKQ